jgi:hypothetical protein
MPVTNYYTANGVLIGEKVGANPRADYLTDALGNVTATMNQSGAITNTYRYKPYGALLAKTGAGADPAFRWVGKHGYRQTGKKYSDVYVRARHDDTLGGRWTSKDRHSNLDISTGYPYAGMSPTVKLDVDGNQVSGPFLTPNCCIHNKPGVIVNGKCRPGGSLISPIDPRFPCWSFMCRMCSAGNNGFGFDNDVSELSNKACQGMLNCGDILNCIGTCPNSTSLNNGCWTEGGGNNGSVIIGLACCVQCSIDMCCLFKSVSDWANTVACDPSGCRSGALPPLPPIKRLPPDGRNPTYWTPTLWPHCLNLIIKRNYPGFPVHIGRPSQWA